MQLPRRKCTQRTMVKFSIQLPRSEKEEEW
jgi:hypothetical protein